MTTPNNAYPPGSTPDETLLGSLTWGDYAEKTQEDWQAAQTAEWETAGDPLSLFGVFIQDLPTLVVVSALSMLADLLNRVPIVGTVLSDIVEQIAAGLNDTDTDAVVAVETAATTATNLESTNTTVTNHQNRITVLEIGDVIHSYEVNDTWTMPTPPGGGNYLRYICAALGGGGGGRKPNTGISGSNNGGYGGQQGGYDEHEYLHASMPGTAAVALGVGGLGATSNNTNGQAGTGTTIGVAGALASAGGGAGGNSTGDPTGPGSGNQTGFSAFGGHGQGNIVSGTLSPTPGNGGNSASGGTAGTTGGAGQVGGPGGNGQDCPIHKIGPGGGGGGGGRGEFGGGKGGNGGYPSAGGGGGGVYQSGGQVGNGGNGADGKGFIISSPTV